MPAQAINRVISGTSAMLPNVLSGVRYMPPQAKLPGQVKRPYTTSQGPSIAMPATPTPTTKVGAADVAEKLGAALNANPISYTAKGLNAYLPSNVQGATDTTLNKLTNWTAKPVTLSADYWNTELANTLKPMEKAYGLAHEQMRGNQALGGTINDSEGYKGTEALATDYLTQIGQATSAVEQAREKEYVASQQWAQEQGLVGAQAAGTMGTNMAQLYGTTGTEESKLAASTALQNKAADINLIGAGLDYSAQNHASNVDMYTAQLKAESEAAGHAIDDYTARAQAEDAVKQREIDYLNLEGYGSEDYWSQVGANLGFTPPEAPQQIPSSMQSSWSYNTLPLTQRELDMRNARLNWR